MAIMSFSARCELRVLLSVPTTGNTLPASFVMFEFLLESLFTPIFWSYSAPATSKISDWSKISLKSYRCNVAVSEFHATEGAHSWDCFVRITLEPLGSKS